MKKILAMAVSVALIAVMAIGGTVAYFTDTDKDVNVMKVGNIDIEQIEEQRKDLGNASIESENLVPFAMDKMLMPSSYFHGKEPAQHSNGIWSVGSSVGAIDKIVHVENKSESPAYIRTIFAFENSGDVDTNGLIHKNYTSESGEWKNLNIGVTIDGQKYNLYSFTYNTPIAKGHAPHSLLQFALDGQADNNDRAAIGSQYHILTFTQAVQSENMEGITAGKSGVEAATAALDAAFEGQISATNHPWINDTTITPPSEITNEESLIKALQEGGNVVLQKDIELTGTAKIAKEVNIDLNGKTLTGNMELSEGADVTISNGTIDNNNEDASAIQANAGAKLTLEKDVEISSARHAVRVEGGEVVINGGTYKVEPISGMTLHALNVSHGGKVIVNDGTFVGPAGTVGDSGSAVQVQANSEVVINDGNFSGGKLYTLSVDGKLTVKGGIFDQNPEGYVADGYKVVGNGPFVVVEKDKKDVDTAKDTASLNAAISGGATTVFLGDGTYAIPSAVAGKTVTISGDEDIVIKCDGATGVNGANITFEGVTFEGSTNNYTGIQGSGDIVYNNVTIKKGTFLYGESVTFNNCTFELDTQYIWTYGAEEVTFNKCTFNTAGKAILVYNEGTVVDQTVNVYDCVFNASKSAYAGDVKNPACAAIEVNSSRIKGDYTINTSSNTVDSDFSGEWRVKVSKSEPNTTINGVKYGAVTVDGEKVA